MAGSETSLFAAFSRRKRDVRLGIYFSGVVSIEQEARSLQFQREMCKLIPRKSQLNEEVY
jgi:hypothetical protein